MLRVAAPTGIFIALALLFYALNPYWFNDAPRYALTIASGEPLRPDWGHLLWRPVGKSVWEAANAVGLGLDPLSVLRLLSSGAAAGLCLVTYALATRLGVPGRLAAAAAALVAGSGAYLLLGGSGTAPAAASFASLVAVVSLLRPGGGGDEWQARHGLVAGVAIGAGWAFWAPAVLLMPVLFTVAALRSTGGWRRRLVRGAAVCALGSGVILATCAATYMLLVRSPGGPSILEWVGASSHGVPMRLTALGPAAAALGFVSGLVQLGDFGQSVKGLLLGDVAVVNMRELVGWGLVAGAVVSLLVAGAVGVAARWRQGDAVGARVGAVALMAVIPPAAVASMWGGASVQQLALSLPYLAVALVAGLSHIRLGGAAPRGSDMLVWVAVAFVWTANVAGRVVPGLLTRGGMVTQLGEVARRHLAPQSMVVVTGQDFRDEVAAAAPYFSGIEVLNLMDDVALHGASGWDRRLRSSLATPLSRGRSVAVVSDLLGDPTPQGVGLSTVEYPTPRMDEVAAVFAGWFRVGEWYVGRYRFVELRPPETWAP